VRLNIADPDTLLLAIYGNDKATTIQGKYRGREGKVVDVDLLHHGMDAFETLVEALRDARALHARNCALLVCHKQVGEFLRPPIKVPQPGTQEVKVGRNKTTLVPAGGDPNHWETFTLLLGYNRWKMWQVQANKMKGTVEAWRQNWQR